MVWTDPRSGITTDHPQGPEWAYPSHPAAGSPAVDPGRPPDHRRRWVIGAIALALAGLVGGYFITSAMVSDDSPSGRATAPVAPATPTTLPAASPTTPPAANNAPPADPDAGALDRLVVQPADVAFGYGVGTIPGGAEVGGETTLDLCNARYPSEARRTARRQVAVVDLVGDSPLGTEAVLYRRPADATQAFTELRRAAAQCPADPVPSPVGGPTVTTKFVAAPDRAWSRTPGVDRLAYDLTTTYDTGDTRHAVVVYLRRGRVLMGVYFTQPDELQVEVDGHTSIDDIVRTFEQRIAALPASVVEAP
jgi:hypothetical protein